MWKFLSSFIIRQRFYITAFILLLTLVMGYFASKIELSYEFAKILPEDDPTFQEYKKFKEKFGADGNVMIVGFENEKLFTPTVFNDWYNLSKTVKIMSGIKEVLALPTVYKLIRNDSLSKFDYEPLINRIPRDQGDLDSLKKEILNLEFYNGIIHDFETGATLMAISFDNSTLDSKKRIEIVNDIKKLSDGFGSKHKIEMHYSGMPFIRTKMMEKISGEMTLFLILGVVITAIILWFFLRSLISVTFSLIVTIFGVIWSVGLLELFGYKITVLSGLIAPLMLVIGIPNCIFMINKYQSEFLRHHNKIKSIKRMIETIGITLFLANVTTAIGFGVLYFTNSSMLVEFGVVAGLGVMATYSICLMLVPPILVNLSAPKKKQTKHLERKSLGIVLNKIVFLVQHKRKLIYFLSALITLISAVGLMKIQFVGYVVDDIPKKDPIYTDLHFFENRFKGVLPFEIVIDSKKENGIFSDNAKTIYKMKFLQSYLSGFKEFSKPISILEAIKFSYQAYKGGEKKYYRIPSVTELKNLSEFNGTLNGQNNRLKLFIDSTKSITRISYQMSDIGSQKMKELIATLRPKVDSIFPKKDYQVSLTGHSLVFLKSNDYLLSNLLESLIIEIVLIAIVGMALFRSVRIIILSKIPCLIPLVITAGIMGFLGIRFKPSTILIFSIAFGISSDGTVYFLSKYRQELIKNGGNFLLAISNAIQETGVSMIYTSIILFFGFSIFSISSFGGTSALGILISLTLIMALFTNLILLPAILLSIANKKEAKNLIDAPPIEIPDDEDLKN